MPNQRLSDLLSRISFLQAGGRDEGESDLDSILRVIAEQLVTLPANIEPINIKCDKNILIKYINDQLNLEENKNKKGFVLLIDELNRLGVPLDQEAAVFLKTEILDREFLSIISAIVLVLYGPL